MPAHSVAVAYRRSVFDRVGLFDESFDACEDVELNHRVDLAGMKCVVVPALRVSYHPRASLAGVFRQMLRYGRGRMRLLRKHPETFSPLGFAPALFLAYILVGPWAALWSRTAAMLYAAALVVYVLIVVGFSAVLTIKNRCGTSWAWLPLVFAALHSGAGAGILLEALQSAGFRAMLRVLRKPLVGTIVLILCVGTCQGAADSQPHTDTYLFLQNLLQQSQAAAPAQTDQRPKSSKRPKSPAPTRILPKPSPSPKAKSSTHAKSATIPSIPAKAIRPSQAGRAATVETICSWPEFVFGANLEQLWRGGTDYGARINAVRRITEEHEGAGGRDEPGGEGI